METKIIRVDFYPRGKELRRLLAERKEECREERVGLRVERAIQASR